MRQLLMIFALQMVFWPLKLNGQAVNNDIPSDLARLFRLVSSDIDDSDKLKVNDSILYLIDGYVRSDTVFGHDISDVKFLGQITSPDSKLKIITWNLLLHDMPGRYYCYFIHRSGKTVTVSRLQAVYSEDPVRTDTEYNEANWYGALYYAARPVRSGDGAGYMLLGIDYGNPAVTRKVIDVLNFKPDGNITLGKKWFDRGNVTKYREVLEYSATAVASLKFVSDREIVFDHLVPVDPAHADNKEFYGPDFSYDSYKYEKGVWKFMRNIDARNKR